MSEQNNASIPYFAHEGEMARMERINKRWFISFLVVLAMLFLTNLGWVLYESQFETYVDQTVDTGEGAAVVAGMGDASYGENQTGDPGAGLEDKR